MSNDDISLDEGAGRPKAYLSLKAPGQYFDVALINKHKAPAYVYGTRDQATTIDGKPKTKDVLTVMVIRGTGRITDEDRVEREAVAGDVAVIYVEGYDRFDPDLDKTRNAGDFKSWSSALADHKQLNVGDVVRWQYERDMPGKGQQPRKIRLFKIRPHRPEEIAQTQKCRELHAAMADVALANAGPANDEPF